MRTRVVFLGERLIQGEEIAPDDFSDKETYRRCAGQWGGPDNVLVLRGVTVGEGTWQERLEYLLVNRAQVQAIGVGTAVVEGLELKS